MNSRAHTNTFSPARRLRYGAGAAAIAAFAVMASLQTVHATNAHVVGHLKVRNSGKCLNIAGAKTTNGAAIIQFRCGNGTNELWAFTNEADGFFEIRPESASEKCLDVSGAKNNDDQPVILFDCNNGSNQRWRRDPTGDGSFELRAKHSGKCLDVAGDKSSDGDKIIQFSCNGQPNQHWTSDQ